MPRRPGGSRWSPGPTASLTCGTPAASATSGICLMDWRSCSRVSGSWLIPTPFRSRAGRAVCRSILKSFGYRRAVLKNSTCWGGYHARNVECRLDSLGRRPRAPDHNSAALCGGEARSPGNDRRAQPTRRYRCCLAAGIEHPAGTILQDMGWPGRPWRLGMSSKSSTRCATSPGAIHRDDRFAAHKQWKASQEDLRVGLPWGGGPAADPQIVRRRSTGSFKRRRSRRWPLSGGEAVPGRCTERSLEAVCSGRSTTMCGSSPKTATATGTWARRRMPNSNRSSAHAAKSSTSRPPPCRVPKKDRLGPIHPHLQHHRIGPERSGLDRCSGLTKRSASSMRGGNKFLPSDSRGKLNIRIRRCCSFRAEFRLWDTRPISSHPRDPHAAASNRDRREPSKTPTAP